MISTKYLILMYCVIVILDSRLSTPLPLTHRIWREIVRFICLKHFKDGHKLNLNDSKVADFIFLEVVVAHVNSSSTWD